MSPTRTARRGPAQRPGAAPTATRATRTPTAAEREGRRLMALAERIRSRAHARYSGFSVGAALLGADGRVFVGCNVENASYGLSMCADRSAVFKAVSEGCDTFVAVAVSAGVGESAAPCGACRQVLHEFAPGMRVYWRDRDRIASSPLAELLAHAFSWPVGRPPRARRGGPR